MSYTTYYGAPQSYPQTPVQHGFCQRRPSSSSASQSHTQTFDAQGFQPRPGSLEFPVQYSFGQSDEWPGSDAEYVALPNTGSNLNLTEINEFTRSEREPPWDPTGRTLARAPDNSLQLFIPTSHVPKANTIAGPLYSSDGFKRPSFGPRQSYASIPDSGYGSQATILESITSLSQAEAQHVELTTTGSLQSNIEVPRAPLSVKTDPSPSGSKPVKRRRSKSFPDKCHCGRELKNRSEAVLQHEKPHRCDRCARKDGFATLNDLERHRKSVHQLSPRVGKTAVYFCRGCKLSPGSLPKKWPRLDNFKAHVKRKHPSCNPDELIKLSEQDKPVYADSQYGYSQASMSNPPEEMAYQQEVLSSPFGRNMSRHASQQQDINVLFFPDSNQQLAHVGGVADYQVNNVHNIHFQQPRYSDENGMMMLQAAANQGLASPVESMGISPTNTRHSIPSIFLNDHAYQYADTDMNQRMQKRSRTHSMPSPAISHATVSSAVTSNVTSAITPSHPEGEHQCPSCQKVKKRECDLRKHMKRHTRPYGCTFAKCNKRFGSRNDWKRHENSQHFLSEMWRCDIERPNGNRCGHLSHDQLQFMKHLEVSHGYKAGTEEIKTRCRDMHLGREGHHHFWCGFCNKLIEQAEGIQPGAWDVRFKHIGDHFDKDNLNIDDWVDIEKNKKKKLIESEQKSKNAIAKMRLDDDSDLGEDGIPPVYVPQAGIARRVVNEEADAEGVSDDECSL